MRCAGDRKRSVAEPRTLRVHAHSRDRARQPVLPLEPIGRRGPGQQSLELADEEEDGDDYASDSLDSIGMDRAVEDDEDGDEEDDAGDVEEPEELGTADQIERLKRMLNR